MYSNAFDVLVEDDPETCTEFAELIYDTEELILIGVTNNNISSLSFMVITSFFGGFLQVYNNFGHKTT